MANLAKITCIEDLRRIAKLKVPKMFYDYCDSGSWTESTYRSNQIPPARCREYGRPQPENQNDWH